MIDRRVFLAMLVLGLAGPVAVPAFAKDGKGGGGDDGGSDGGGGSDDGGNSGSGSDDGGSDDSGGKSGSGTSDDDDDRIRSAVRKGEAESLRNILSIIRKRYNGDIIRIRLTGKGSSLQYRIRMITSESKLVEIRVNAKTAKILGVTGL